jgi:protein gp37
VDEMSTKIEWADEVWNPVTGCTKISEGCRNCYAESIAKRFWGERKFSDVKCHPERLDIPLHWKKPRRVFVNSMSDLFHIAISDIFIFDCFRTIEKAKQHTFIVLTKRPHRMRRWFDIFHAGEPLPNLWLGVSVEDQSKADERIAWLRGIPAAVRFVSVEPMLERVDLTEWLSGLDWVICGGESGKNARPHPSLTDVRYLKDQCVAAGVPFFLKQMWGKKMPELDGKVWDEYPIGELRQIAC